MDRPAVDKRMSIQEFTQHYWYKEELKNIFKCNIFFYETKTRIKRKIKEFLIRKVSS